MPNAPSYRATVAALALGQLLTWAALFYGFSSFVLPMQRELGWDKPTLMGAYTLGLAVWGGAAFAIGAAIDRGRGRAVMTWGAAAGGIGCLAWSQVSAPWMFYAVWALLGIAMAATLYEPAFAILTKRYPQRWRDGITTLTLVGGLASTLSFPAVAALQAWLGWRASLVVIGAGVLAVAPLHHWALRGPALVAAAPGVREDDDATLREALRDGAFWLLSACFTLYAFVQAGLWAHVMPAFAAKGVGQADALKVLVCIGPAQVVGRLVFAWIGRGWSLRALGAVVLAALPLALLLFALGRSGVVPLYFGRTPVGRIGALMSSVGLVARAGAPLAVAWALALLAGYRELLLGLAGASAVAVIAFWLAGPPAPRARGPAGAALRFLVEPHHVGVAAHREAAEETVAQQHQRHLGGNDDRGHVVQHDVADANARQADEMDRHRPAGGLRHAAAAVLPVQADAGGL